MNITCLHRWNDTPPVRLAAESFPDGNARTEKTCPKCGLVKITVHPPHGFPWREWRTREGKIWHGASTPPCLVQGGGGDMSIHPRHTEIGV